MSHVQVIVRQVLVLSPDLQIRLVLLRSSPLLLTSPKLHKRPLPPLLPPQIKRLLNLPRLSFYPPRAAPPPSMAVKPLLLASSVSPQHLPRPLATPPLPLHPEVALTTHSNPVDQHPEFPPTFSTLSSLVLPLWLPVFTSSRHWRFISLSISSAF
jgi:hypothetical protein